MSASIGVRVGRVLNSPETSAGEPLGSDVSMQIAKHTLISGGTILAIGTLTALLAQKIKIPDIPVFLFVGMAIGPQVLRIN